MGIRDAFKRTFSEKWQAWLALAVWAAALVGYFFASQPWAGLYVDNQHTYFIQGLLRSGRHPYLQADLFAQTRPLHIAFTYLVAGLERLGSLAGAVAVFDVLFRLVFLFSLWLLVNAFWGWLEPERSRTEPLRKTTLTLSVLSFYLLSLWPVFHLSVLFEHWGFSLLAKAWEKFGFYYSFGGFASFRYYFEPAAFSMLILPALAVLPYKKWRLAAGLLGAAALFHASFLLHTGAIMGTMVVYLWVKKQRKAAWQSALIYALFVLPLVLYTFINLTDGQTAAANAILAFNRVPHHALPARWWSLTSVLHAIVIAAAVGLLMWKSRGGLRWTMAVTTVYVGLGIAFVAITENASAAIMMPWRASGYLYAIAQLVVLATGVFGIVKVLERVRRRAAFFFALLPVALLVSGIGDQGLFWPEASLYNDLTTVPYYDFMAQISEQTEPDAVLITPLRQAPYRLGTQRAVFVDWKSHPYKGAEVLDWWARVEFVREFYEMDGPARQSACQTVGVDYYVLDAATRSEGEPAFISWEDLVLIPCPGP